VVAAEPSGKSPFLMEDADQQFVFWSVATALALLLALVAFGTTYCLLFEDEEESKPELLEQYLHPELAVEHEQ